MDLHASVTQYAQDSCGAVFMGTVDAPACDDQTCAAAGTDKRGVVVRPDGGRRAFQIGWGRGAIGEKVHDPHAAKAAGAGTRFAPGDGGIVGQFRRGRWVEHDPDQRRSIRPLPVKAIAIGLAVGLKGGGRGAVRSMGAVDHGLMVHGVAIWRKARRRFFDEIGVCTRPLVDEDAGGVQFAAHQAANSDGAAFVGGPDFGAVIDAGCNHHRRVTVAQGRQAGGGAVDHRKVG